MIDNRTFDYILELCNSLDKDTLIALKNNIDIIIENKEEEDYE